MWKQHIVGAVIATFIIAAGISINPYFAAGSDEHHWGFKRAKNGEQAEAGAQLDQLLDKYKARATSSICTHESHCLPEPIVPPICI